LEYIYHILFGVWFQIKLEEVGMHEINQPTIRDTSVSFKHVFHSFLKYIYIYNE